MVACAAVATVLVPVATSSGEALEQRVGDPGEHAALGDQLIWFAIPVLVLSAALVLARPPALTGAAPPGSAVAGSPAVAVLAVVASLASAVQVYRVGESGARAAWGDQVSASDTP